MPKIAKNMLVIKKHTSGRDHERNACLCKCTLKTELVTLL